MVNGFKGEVLIKDDDGNKYKFHLGMWAHVSLEEATGSSWPAFWKRVGEWTDTDTLILFCAGLAKHHEDMGRRDVADLMDRLGPVRCREILEEAIKKASPDPGSEEEANGSARPTSAKRKRHPPQATIT